MQALDPSRSPAPARTTDGECARPSQSRHWTFGSFRVRRALLEQSLIGRARRLAHLPRVQRPEVLLFKSRIAIASIAALIASSAVASAQASAQADTAIDPDAIAALNKMGAY